MKAALHFFFLCAAVSGALIPRHSTIVSRDIELESEYDFVIAGGGISGLTVADRLTEDPNGTIPLRIGFEAKRTNCGNSQSSCH
jgi:ribulose 1,5-bisphosphate synthetase/thiazole synthase